MKLGTVLASFICYSSSPTPRTFFCVHSFC